MSYSFSVQGKASEIAGLVDAESANVTGQQTDQELADAMADHFVAARDSAHRMAMIVGQGFGEDGQLSVSVSGHAHPGHGDSDSWADESMTISVSVVRDTS